MCCRSGKPNINVILLPSIIAPEPKMTCAMHCCPSETPLPINPSTPLNADGWTQHKKNYTYRTPGDPS